MRRRLLLLLLLYVTLDFANPLMPGAVRFEGGSIEVVQADRVGTQPVSTLARLPIMCLRPSDSAVARPTHVPPVLRHRALRLLRRPGPERLDAPASPTEGH
jgi:hypothetical protein